MKVIDSLDSPLRFQSPALMTIGNFDGVHSGHTALLKHLVQIAKSEGAIPAVFTFTNHPSEILRPSNPTPLLCTYAHKVKLIEQAGIALLIAVPFTDTFAQQTAEQFLKWLHHAIPIKKLILGSDAHIGKDREGNSLKVKTIASSLGFGVEYVPDILQAGKRVSSSSIREAIAQGNLQGASILLGRPYSIYSTVIRGEGKGKALGYPTANISVRNLCLPPLGVYAVDACCEGSTYRAVANLGTAPTLHNKREPLLEVHILDQERSFYDKTVEIIFKRFLRQEKRFSSQEELRTQIAKDIEEVTKGT